MRIRKPAKPSRFYLFLFNHRRRVLVGAAAFLSTVALIVSLFTPNGRLRWIIRYMDCYRREAGIVWREAPIMDIQRPCPAPDYKLLRTDDAQPPRICLTTLTDRKSTSSYQRFWRCRDFDNVNTFSNHHQYAMKHQYLLRDGSDLIDTSRPPAWSKIRAVQKLMTNDDCDWIMWLDADVVIMNSDIRIESLLPADPNIHLIVTHDKKYKYNSGSWLIRNQPWSRDFLETWWDQTDLVIPAGASLSGDNAAFGHLLVEKYNDSSHVREIPRCTMNSFAVFVTDRQLSQLDLQKQEWYLSDKFYHKGDFIAHASAVDKKSQAVEMLLERAA